MGDAFLASLMEAAMAHDAKTALLERAWTRSRNISKARGESVKLDSKIDTVHGVMHSTVKDNIAAFSTEDPIVDASKHIIDQIYPEGLRPIVKLPFEDQLLVNDTIIARLKGDLKEEAEKRRALVDPILEQVERIRQARKGRQSAPDVDPDTGEELPEETAA